MFALHSLKQFAIVIELGCAPQGCSLKTSPSMKSSYQFSPLKLAHRKRNHKSTQSLNQDYKKKIHSTELGILVKHFMKK